MKKIILVILTLYVFLCLSSCDLVNSGSSNEDSDGDTLKYPEGAIALTEDNFTDYFEIKTTATCDYNFYTEKTDAVAYVALIPKYNYKEATGEVRFDVDTRVYKWYGNQSFKIVNTEQSLLLNKDIVNDSYRMTIQEPYSSTDPYKLKTDSIGVTVNSLYGYVIMDEREAEPNEIERLTAEQKSNSTAIYLEVSELIDSFKANYKEASSYAYLRKSSYNFLSYYGIDMSKSHSSIGYNYKIDKVNNRFESGNGKYYSIDGSWYEQAIWAGTELVRTSSSGLNMSIALEESTPIWDVLDGGATYLKSEDGKYIAYVSLEDMKEGSWKEQIESKLQAYRITAKHDEFVVKYEYDLTDGGFKFYISIHYADPRYHVEYVDVTYNVCQKITGLDETTVELYSPETHSFMLSDSFEDAEFFKNGLIEIDGNTTEISYVTYSYQYQGDPTPPYENYLPIRILEGGVYNFTPDSQTITVLNENGKVHGYYSKNNYFPAGIYYIRSNYVTYGLTTVTVSIESRIYDDYGDLNNPTDEIQSGGGFECVFEGNGDLNVLSFTPTYSGLYSFGDHEHVSLTVYRNDDLDNPIASTWPTKHNVELVSGTEYVIALECVNYLNGTEKFTYTGTARYVGEVTPANTALSSEWLDVLMFTDSTFLVTPSAVGYYYVEYAHSGGYEVSESFFYDTDGKSYTEYKTVKINGKEVMVYALDKATYVCNPEFSRMNEYFEGRARLVCYEEGITESKDIVLSSNEYITITTSNLNTLYSYSSFTFTISETCKLLITLDSDFFAMYDENGRRYGTTVYPTYIDTEFGNVETNYVSNLEPGTYTIVFAIEGSYSTLGEKTATVRLMPI